MGSNNFEQISFFTAADSIIKLHNPDRITKHVDGDYDPPSECMPDNHCYTMWYNGHGIDLGKLHKGYWLEVKPNWYYGCGEFGSEGLDFKDIMYEYYPKEWIKEPFDPNNIIGAQTGNFHYSFYETPKSVKEWVEESHKHQAFATKIMTNAMRRDNNMITFAIHLFIDAWPSGWMKAIMDFKRNPKPSYFTYRDCLTPLMANLRTDRFTYFAGEKVKIESYICNDCEEIEGTEVCYMVEFDNKIIYSSKEAATIKKNQTTFQGFVEFDVPKVASREKFVIYMAIIKYGEVLHYTKEEYTAFPEIEESNIEFLDYDCYDKSRAEINQEIRNGRKVIFAPLREGEYIIAEKKITVKNCGMQTLYFVSRDTGHKMVEEFEKGDFSYWYDEKEDRLAPIIYATFEGENIKPILTSGNNNKGWRKTFACGEFEFGEGQVVICQLDLNNKYKNPVARKFSTKLIE